VTIENKTHRIVRELSSLSLGHYTASLTTTTNNLSWREYVQDKKISIIMEA
jgi:hypothetical protein